MILINLLPHREAKRKRRKEAFFAGLGMAALCGALLLGATWLMLQQLISSQRERNDYLTREITQLDTQIKDIATLKTEIESLKARQVAVEALQADRNTPVHLLNELSRHTPEGMYLTTVKQNDAGSVQVVGLAQTTERVSEFMRNLSRHSEWLENPQLGEIKLAQATTTGRDARRLFEFSLNLKLKGLSPPASAASAASAARRSGG